MMPSAIIGAVEEFYTLDPGPSSSPSIGPMSITCDFYQRSPGWPGGLAVSLVAW